MNYFIFIILIISIYFIYTFYFKKNIESFSVTWTPYFVDKYNQPGYTNYLYHNGYMYPVF